VERKKFNKNYTIVQGIDEREIGLKDLAKKLKSELACGGTIKDGKIELQGEHKQKVKVILVKHGFMPSSIEIR
ncbi:MAG: translation initiation factor Sui1, partial [Bdellovibrionales bacterium RIFOXYB2_FULL_36_6]